MNYLSILRSINQDERSLGNYNLSDSEITMLEELCVSEIIRFPTTFVYGLNNPSFNFMKSMKLVDDHSVLSSEVSTDYTASSSHSEYTSKPIYTLNSCYAGYLPENINDLISHLKTFKFARVGAHGINGDMIGVNHSDYQSISMVDKIVNDCIVTLYYSIWNVNILSLLSYLHPARKIEGINFGILVTEDFKQCVNNRTQFKLYRPSIPQIKNQKLDNDNFVRSIDAVFLYNDLMKAIQVSGVSIINIDMTNLRNMNSNIGNVICSNICTEIVPVGDFACTLSSVNLHNCVKNSIFDMKLFESAITIIVKILNLAINITKFTTNDSISYFNKHVLRPIGIGVTGYANCLIDQGICYEDSNVFATKLFSRMLVTACNTSIDIGVKWPELISTKWYGTKWSMGKLPIDLWDYSKYVHLDRETEDMLSSLRKRLTTTPMVNCNLIAHMPTLRRVHQMNLCLSITPLHSLVTEVALENVRKIYTVRGLPQHLESKAIALKGQWTPEFGDVFKTSHEMDQKKIITIYYIAQAFCDMAISITPHFKNNDLTTVMEYLKIAYNLNTPLYYLRLDIMSDLLLSMKSYINSSGNTISSNDISNSSGSNISYNSISSNSISSNNTTDRISFVATYSTTSNSTSTDVKNDIVYDFDNKCKNGFCSV